MTTKEILIAARAKIENPESWIKGLSWNRRGGFCASGAIAAVCLDGSSDGWAGALDALGKVMGCRIVADYNDSHTHEEVLAKFDEAIAAA